MIRPAKARVFVEDSIVLFELRVFAAKVIRKIRKRKFRGKLIAG